MDKTIQEQLLEQQIAMLTMQIEWKDHSIEVLEQTIATLKEHISIMETNR